MDIAIKRKGEKMSDLIDRQAVIDALYHVNEYNGRSIKAIRNLPSAQPERKAPISYKEQLSLDCSFCRQHECGDTLYESSDWDGGIGFDYIRNIRFCPICGRKLYGDE